MCFIRISESCCITCPIPGEPVICPNRSIIKIISMWVGFTDFDVIKTVKEQIEGYDFGLSEIEKKEIIQDCLSEMKSLLDRKSNF